MTVLRAALILSLFAFPRFAAAQPQYSGTTGFTACLSMRENQCRLIAPTIAISIGVENGDAVISYLDPAPGGYVVQRRDSITKDLESQIATGAIGNDQAAYIFAELLSMHDLMYRLPVSEEVLKREVGFPPQAILTPEDQIGVLTSHLQITLGVSAVTADYLMMKLGIQVVGKTGEVAKPAEAPRVSDLPTIDQYPQTREAIPAEQTPPAATPESDPNLSVEGYQPALKQQTFL
jgi:hypothetical protein